MIVLKQHLGDKLMRSTWLLLFLPLAAITGCGEAATTAPPECTSQSGCGPGSVCSVANGKCVAAAGSAGLEVVPPTNVQGWVVQEFPKPSVEGDGSLVLKLQPAVSLQGFVYAADSSSKDPIPAHITALRDSQLPGLGKVQVDVTYPSNKRDSSGKDSFVLWLTRGQTYSFLVSPQEPYDADYPPLVESGVKMLDDLKHDFVLVGKSTSIEVTGTIRSASVGTALKDPVRVRAYRPGGLYHSSLGKTDTTGKFSLRVAPTVGDPGVAIYTVVVESFPDKPPIPTMTCNNITLGLIPAQQTNQEIGELRLPAFAQPLDFTVRVKGKPADTRSQVSPPVAGATVTFSTVMDAVQNAGFDKCTATYEQTAITDGEGKATLQLVPAPDAKANRFYSVKVISPPRSPYASQWVKSYEVGAKAGVLFPDLVLEPRFHISGRVAAAGKGVASASIEAQGIGSGAAQLPLPPAKATSTSDANGDFVLYLDPGIYNIDIRPPQDIGLPSFGLTAVLIEGNTEGRLFEVPSAKGLAGRVLDPKGQLLPSAQVRVYDLVPGSQQPLVQKALLRTSSITDATGAFYLLLPAPTE